MCRVSQVLQGGVGVGVGLLACLCCRVEGVVGEDGPDEWTTAFLRGMKRLGFFKSYVLPGKSVGITEGWVKKRIWDGREREKKVREAKGQSGLILQWQAACPEEVAPNLSTEEDRGREESEAPMPRCSGCDLNRACKSPFSHTQHARTAAAATSTAEHGREMETSQDRYLLMSWCQKRYAAKGRRHRMARPTPPSSIPPSHGPPPFTHTPLPCQEIHGGAPLLESNCLDAAIFFTCQRAA